MAVHAPETPRDFDFDATVRAYTRQLERYIFREFHGKVDPEDVLQDTWTKIWRLQAGFHADPRPLRNKLYEYAHRAAIDLLKRQQRGGIPVDPTGLDNHDTPATGALKAASETLIRNALAATRDPSVFERSILVTALAALSKPQQLVVWAHVQGGVPHRQIAEQLSTPESPINEQGVKELYLRAMKIMRPLIEHAAGLELDDHERARLHAYLDGTLSRRESAVFRQHLTGCDTCRRYIDLETGARERAARVFLPLPLLLPGLVALGPHAAGAHATAASSSHFAPEPSPAGGASVAAHSGSAKLATQAAVRTTTKSGGLGGAKAALFVTGGLLVVGGGGAVYAAWQYEQSHRAHRTAAAVSAHAPRPAAAPPDLRSGTLLAASQVAAPKPRPRHAAAGKRPRVSARASGGLRRVSVPPTTTASVPNQQTPSASTAAVRQPSATPASGTSSAPRSSSGTSAPKHRSTASGPNAEFAGP